MEVQKIIKESWDSVIRLKDRALQGLENMAIQDAKPPPGYCSNDEITKEMNPNPESYRLERQQAADRCNAKKQAELKESESRAKADAANDARNLQKTNTEGTLLFCENRKGGDKQYCEYVDHNFETAKSDLIKYLLKQEPSDLRNSLIDTVRSAESPSVVFNLTMKVALYDFKAEANKETRLGNKPDENRKDIPNPANFNGKQDVRIGPFTFGYKVEVGVKITRPENKFDKVLDDAKKAVNVPGKIKKEIENDAREIGEKVKNEVKEVIKQPEE